MEKIKLVEVLNDNEKKIVFSLVDALVGKKKLKDALSFVLNEAKSKSPHLRAFAFINLNSFMSSKTNENKAPSINKNLFLSTL